MTRRLFFQALVGLYAGLGLWRWLPSVPWTVDLERAARAAMRWHGPLHPMNQFLSVEKGLLLAEVQTYGGGWRPAVATALISVREQARDDPATIVTAKRHDARHRLVAFYREACQRGYWDTTQWPMPDEKEFDDDAVTPTVTRTPFRAIRFLT